MGALDKDQILGILAEDYMTPEAIELVARARAMAPDDTTMTSTPRARRAAISAATPASQSVLGVASRASTTRALPIFTTQRCAPVTLLRIFFQPLEIFRYQNAA